MVRDAETIQAEIERARDGLAAAVNEVATRVDPHRAIETSKAKAHEIWSNPRVKIPLIAGGALIALLLVRKLFR